MLQKSAETDHNTSSSAGSMRLVLCAVYVLDLHMLNDKTHLLHYGEPVRGWSASNTYVGVA